MNEPTPLEKAVERSREVQELAASISSQWITIEDVHFNELLHAIEQLSILRQNSVAKSVWDETHAKYLEECEKNLALQNENVNMREVLMICNTVGQQTHIQLRIDTILATPPTTTTDNSKESK